MSIAFVGVMVHLIEWDKCKGNQIPVLQAHVKAQIYIQ